MQSLRSLLFLLLCSPALLADGPADNLPDKVRRIPPPGLPVPEAVRTELSDGVRRLGDEVAALRKALTGTGASFEQRQRARLLPDVEIFHKAVDWALRHDEFFNTNQFRTARNLLREGTARGWALRE